mgnify:CR=1 FL=1
MVYTGTFMIDELYDRLVGRLKQKLPGYSAQRKMSPSIRNGGEDYPDPKFSQASSVLILVFPKGNQVCTVLIERTAIGPHASQISLPGGKRDKDDPSDGYTALRETWEEVGVKPENIEIIGNLSPLYVPHSNFGIHPYIAFTTNEPDFIPNPDEVASILIVSIEQLFSSTTKRNRIISDGSMNINAPYYDVEGHMVWGATAMILSEFETILK